MLFGVLVTGYDCIGEGHRTLWSTSGQRTPGGQCVPFEGALGQCPGYGWQRFQEACWQQVPLWGDCGLHSIREQTGLGEQSFGETWGLLPTTVLLISTCGVLPRGPLNHRVNLWQTGSSSSKIWSFSWAGIHVDLWDGEV